MTVSLPSPRRFAPRLGRSPAGERLSLGGESKAPSHARLLRDRAAHHHRPRAAVAISVTLAPPAHPHTAVPPFRGGHQAGAAGAGLSLAASLLVTPTSKPATNPSPAPLMPNAALSSGHGSERRRRE